MIDRPRRPAPRTLSSTPPASSRAPQSATYQARFPSLVAVIAGGALVPACHAPECGSTRSDELETHGSQSMRDLRNGASAEALREIGLALGVIKHDASTRIQAPGETPVVTTTPQTTPEIQPPGAAPQVIPTPPTPPTPPIAPSGGPMQVQPDPPQPPPPVPPAQRTRPHAEPRHPRPLRGSAPATTANPHDLLKP